MELILREMLKELEKDVACLLATVIRTKGSTPQKPGAKLLVRKDGSAVGTLGGGCIEGNIWYLAKTLLSNHGEPQTSEFVLNEEIAARDGMVCGGSMKLLLDPIREPRLFLPYVREILAACKGERALALAILTRASTDFCLQVGAKLLIWEDGSRMGTLGSQELDDEAAKKAIDLMACEKEPFLVALNGTDIFLEAYTSPPTLVLMGGGHVSRAVAPLAKNVGFRVYVIDDRAEFANPERFPEAEATIVGDFAQGLADVPITQNTYIIVATRGHRDDDQALEAAALTQVRYIGLLGSKRKVVLIFEELMKKGIALERIKDVHAPIGLDIRARTPEEIALSIVAELVKFRLGGSGNSMKLDERQIVRVWEKLQREHTFTRNSEEKRLDSIA